MLLLYYTIAFLIALYILFLAYVKITYTFWSRQPVFHFYNLMYWFFPPGIIMHDLPEQNKYTNFSTRLIQISLQIRKTINICLLYLWNICNCLCCFKIIVMHSNKSATQETTDSYVHN